MAGVNPQTGLWDANYDPTTAMFNTQQQQATFMQPNTMSVGYNPQAQQQLNQSLYGNTFQPDQQLATDINNLTQQPTNTGFFGDVSGTDWLNFGTSAVGLGLGAYYQKQALDQQQQSLDLAQSKYDTYQKEQQELDNAYASFG